MVEEFLTEEQIAQTVAATMFSNLYYVYFDSTGEIKAITNEKNPNRVESFLEVEYNRVEKFLSNKENRADYKVSLVAKDMLSIIKKTQDASTNTSILKVVEPSVSNNTLLVVEWNPSGWKFFIQDGFKSQIAELGLNTRMSFFVTLENNMNFLVRTIDIDLETLVKLESVSVPFLSKMEKDITNLVISTRGVFDSYGLLING